MDLVARQIELEEDAFDLGYRRFKDEVARNDKTDRIFSDSPTDNLFREALEACIPGLRKLRRECRASLLVASTTGKRLRGHEAFIEPFEPEFMAFVALRTLFVAGRDEHRIQRVASSIGRALNTDLRWNQARKFEARAARERGYTPPNRLRLMKRRVREVNPKNVKKWLKKFDDIETTEWSKADHFRVGAAVLSVVLEAVPDVIKKVTVRKVSRGRQRIEVNVQFTEGFLEEVWDKRSLYADNFLKPVLRPMVIEPLPVDVTNPNNLTGGYLTDRVRSALKLYVIKHKVGGDHTKNRMSALGQEHMNMINKMSQTAWRVNAPILERATRCLSENVGPVPYNELMDMPESVSAEVWAKMSREERGVVKSRREVVHSNNNRALARKESAHRVLEVAREYDKYDKFWFPHSVDFRGRVYPLPQEFNVQGDDFTRALLTFAEGKPLGETGLQWLAFHMANCFGMDKVDRQGQADWVNENQAEIFNVASDPFGVGLEFWKQADEPWQFLAAAIEYCSAWSHPVSPEYFISHLPVQVDGSCNGLQHLSAMGLDPVGAKAVNLMPGPRQDIYQIVADKVNDAIEVQYDTEDHEAHPGQPCVNWRDRVTRKTVKRGVMTTPYGVTDIGIRDQLIKDRWTEPLEGDAMKNADYLKGCILDAREDVLGKAVDIMNWMVTCVSLISDVGKPIMWRSPSGFHGREYYFVPRSDKVSSLLGRLHMAHEGDRTISKTKQKQAVAPNIIHSFDAAHLAKSVGAAPSDMSFSMIHDSFGCHAADMEEFGSILRAEFVTIYSENWLEKLHQDFVSSAEGAVEIPQPPSRSNFDIQQVLDAEFFFA